MSLPLNQAASATVASALLYPDDSVRSNLLVDYELGGVALNDASQGLQVQVWKAFVQGGNVCVAPQPANSPVIVLFAADDVTELSLAFDQLMHPTVAFVQAGVCKLYWFDSLAAAQVVTSFPGATTPMLCLDDKRPLQVLAGVVDVLFFYVLGSNLCYRQQRDRFTIERVLSALPPGSSVITSVGMGVNGRVQVHMNAALARHVDLAEDKVYLLNETGQVLPMHDGAPMTAKWRSRLFEFHDQPSFGWARVDADGWPVTLKLLAGKVVVSTLTVTSDEPVRLPDVRSREWAVEVSAASRVVAVVVASSREELEGADAGNL